MSAMKSDLQKDMSKGFIDVYKAINDVQKSIVDVQKSITRMTVYFISAIGTIAIIFKVLDIVFGSNP